MSIVSGYSKVLTENGLKKIKKIKIGDYVLSRHGRYCKVTEIHKIPFNKKEIIRIKYNIKNSRKELLLTKEHKLYTNRGLIKAEDLKSTDKLCQYIINGDELIKEWISIKSLAVRTKSKKYSFDISIDVDSSYVCKSISISDR